MSATANPAPIAAEQRESHPALVSGLWAFAAVHLLLGVFMAAAPRTFFTAVGPFGTLNEHYIRDMSTFYLAVGAATVVAARVPSWRVPVLAITALQYVLHSANHLLDIDRAHPVWTGYFDFFALLAATLLLVRLLSLARGEARATHRTEGAHP